MQINRLFEILYILLNKRLVTAKELAEHFEVSPRTIYRDVDTLSSAGIPIYTEKGKGGGIGLLPGFVLHKSILSEQEQNEILSALNGLSHMKVIDTEHVLKKLSIVFNKTAANWLEVDFSSWSFDDGDLWGDLKTAILERKVVEFDYYSGYGERTRRRIEPVQLCFKSRSWYLKGYCLGRCDTRLFKLTRVRSLSVTDGVFTEREFCEASPEPEAEEDKRPNILLKLKVAAEMTYRILDDFGGSNIQKEPDGSFIITECWREDNWLYSLVLSYGEYIEVLEPEHIRDTIKEKVQMISEKYL